MRVALAAVVMVSATALLWGAWGPVPEGRVGAWMLEVRARLCPPTAEDRYRLAERFYEAGDFEKSELECQKALRMNPGHAPSRALFTEVSFILGQGKASPSTLDYDRFMGPMIGYQQLLIEIDNALERAERHRVMGEREAALKEVRKVLEFAKWMPEGVELQDRRHKAEVLKALLTVP
jgi:hypothetical protein